MKWCMECGAVGKPEPAVTTHEGDPLCAGCAKARGTVFNAEFLDRRMAEHKALEQEPSAPKEKVVAKCKCGCGQEAAVSRFYVRGHKPKNDKPAGAQIAPRAPSLKSVAPVPLPPPNEALIDLVWNALPEAQKRAALRSLLDSIL